MEETLGKRIVGSRKRLGLTQDQLAERLGVTAQAVSKWENDQSCPDITMLPKLAEIFGISTDALLGIEPQKEAPAREAELVPADEQPNEKAESSSFPKGRWEFTYDAGKNGSIGFAALILLVAGLLLTGTIMDWDVSFWGLLWPSALLVFGIMGLFPDFSFFHLGMILFGGYFLLDELDFLPAKLGGNLVFPVILLLFGLSLLADALRKPKKSHFSIHHNGRPASKDGKHQSNFNVDGESFDCSTSFGEDNQYISLPRLSHGSASISFGELTVDLSGCEKVADNCHIDASCSFGELEFLVPRRYRVEPASSTAFASVEVSGHPDSEPAGVIFMDANASFGEICIRYI